MEEATMVAIPIEAQVTLEELLRAVSRLSSPDLNEFVQRVLLLQSQRRAPTLPEAEAELLLKINQGPPEDVWQRYGELVARRKGESLTSEEHQELLHLSDEIDTRHTRRVECLAELARLRNTSLRQLMDELGIRPAPHE
jgi:hypothetical protein